MSPKEMLEAIGRIQCGMEELLTKEPEHWEKHGGIWGLEYHLGPERDEVVSIYVGSRKDYEKVVYRKDDGDTE